MGETSLNQTEGDLGAQETMSAQFPPVLVGELRYSSLGYRVQESAEAQGVTFEAIRSRRKRTKAIFGASTTSETIVKAIQAGYVHIEIGQEIEFQALSPMQMAVLHLVARGMTVENIAKRCELSRHTVNSHYEEIRQRLGAHTISHAMRRAFELGIFKTGEEIVDPEELVDILTGGLQIAIEDHIYKPGQIGIIHPRQIEALSLMGQLERGFFKSSDLHNLGFLGEAENKTEKTRILGRAIISIIKKLEAAHGQTVLKKLNNRGERTYAFLLPVAIGRTDAMRTIPAFEEEDVEEHANIVRARLREQAARGGYTSGPKRTSPPAIEKPPIESPAPPHAENSSSSRAESLPLQDSGLDEYQDPSSLPDLSTEFLANLGVRDPQEVLENGAIKVAVDSVIHQDLLREYRSRVIIPLRYGVRGGVPMMVRRGEDCIRLEEIMEYVPAYQGLDLSSVSQLVGLPPTVILQVEQEFIDLHKKQYPALGSLESMIRKQMDELRKNETLYVDALAEG